MILSFYLVVAFIVCYYSRLVQHKHSDILQAWTHTAGLTCFLIGLLGNFYHHYLLATLRKPGEKGYKIPRGGFFEFVAAPHYLFELIGWLGAAIFSQHCVVFLLLADMTVYLGDRSLGQSEWNRKKVQGYPKGRKNLIPFIF